VKVDRSKRYGEDFDVERDTANFIDNLLLQYQPYLFDDKKNFLDRLNSFDYGTHQAAFWEMFLVFYLKKAGLYVLSVGERRQAGESLSDKRPDIRVLYGDKTIWVEAVSLRSGKSAVLDSFLNPPEHECEFVGLPEDEILLRYTTAIESKQKAFREYKNVGANDAKVIAVNTGMIWRGGFQSTDNVPRLAKVLYGIGNSYIAISTDGRDVIKSGHERRRVISKNGVYVPSDFFADSSCGHISAILASDIMPRSAAKAELYDPSHWVLARNPHAAVQVENCFLSFEPDIRFRSTEGVDYVHFTSSRFKPYTTEQQTGF
jgi:hypothetical protein